MLMLSGRDYRKAISQGIAYGIYRWIAIWLIIAVCASKGELGIAAGLVIAAVDIIVLGGFRGTEFTLRQMSRDTWRDHLTDRFFYKLLFDEIRSGNNDHIDIDELFKLASKEAGADIKRADDNSVEDAGVFGTTAWHWFGGAISFVGCCVWFVLYYASALYLGSGGSSFWT
jgi:hypothetical protein